MIRIRSFKRNDKAAWDRYIDNHPEGTFFHLSTWKDVVEASFGHKSFYLVAESTDPGSGCGKIAGVLPLFEMKSLLFGHYLVSVPFAESGGVLADNRSAALKLLNKAMNLAEDRKCSYLELRNRNEQESFLTKSLYYSFRRRIYNTAEKNLMAIPRKSRRMVRVGIKNGLYSEAGDHLFEEFYGLLAKNYHRLGTPVFQQSFLKNFIFMFKKRCSIMVVRNRERKAIAGVMSFFYKDQVIPYYAGSDIEYRNLAPNDFMYFELMNRGLAMGYGYFDFGRSKLGTGSFRFKKHWGFKPVPLFYQYQLFGRKNLPDMSPANPKYRRRIEIWRKLPLQITVSMGPFISRFLA